MSAEHAADLSEVENQLSKKLNKKTTLKCCVFFFWVDFVESSSHSLKLFL
jgi:hypothetical protein